jgi:uncharacterized protein with HEPN domain
MLSTMSKVAHFVAGMTYEQFASDELALITFYVSRFT